MAAPAGDEISYRTLEWAAGMFDQWIAVNEEAQDIQRHLPPAVAERVHSLPAGMQGLGPTLALQTNPDTVIVSHAILASARRIIGSMMNGSVSHPLFMMILKTDAGNGASMARDFEAEVHRLEARVAELEGLQERYQLALRMVRDVSGLAVASSGDRLLDEVEICSADGGVSV